MDPDSLVTWYNCSQQGAKGGLGRRQETEGKKRQAEAGARRANMETENP